MTASTPRTPTITTVDDFSDLIADDWGGGAAEGAIAGEVVDENEYGIDLEDAIKEVSALIDGAVSFIESELFPIWERADDFIDGETDLKVEDGRSSAVQTVVRDAVRALKPNMMRVYTETTAICQFSASNTSDFSMAGLADAQTAYANQLFWTSGGYLALANTITNALTKKGAILKSWFRDIHFDTYITLRHVTPEQLEALEQMEEVHVVSVEDEDEGGVGVTGLLQVEVAWRQARGEIRLDSVPNLEFFVDDHATCPEDATIIGQRRAVTVAEARGMGLEYHDWLELTEDDPNKSAGGGSQQKRVGYGKNMELEGRDLANHRFLLTEAYAYFDLDNTGLPQLYRFWLGGAHHEYLDHDRVTENPYSVAQADPVPGAFFGNSIPELLDEDQNTQTSMLRASLDNAHLANNRRLAVHDTMVNMADVMNKALGAPIRVRQPGQIQEIGTESTLGTMLPFLEFLKSRANDKVGVTNASMGLDPDALQSTDKAAVQNTIQLAQGQVELMCRNIAETGLAPAFVKLLKLSMRHKPDAQTVFLNGFEQPISQAVLRPEMHIKAGVGLGTGNMMMKMQTLQSIAAKQEQIIQEYGPNNPLCGLPMMMNTIVDMGRISGIHNMGRYFNQATPEVAAALQQMAEQKAAAQQVEPPSEAIKAAEMIRAQARIAEKQADSEMQRETQSQKQVGDIIKMLMTDDLARDKMAQELEVERARLANDQVDKLAVAAEQQRERDYSAQSQLVQLAARRTMEAERQQEALAPQRSQLPAPANPATQGGPQGSPQATEGLPPQLAAMMAAQQGQQPPV